MGDREHEAMAVVAQTASDAVKDLRAQLATVTRERDEARDTLVERTMEATVAVDRARENADRCAAERDEARALAEHERHAHAEAEKHRQVIADWIVNEDPTSAGICDALLAFSAAFPAAPGARTELETRLISRTGKLTGYVGRLIAALNKTHACATVRADGKCDGCHISEALDSYHDEPAAPGAGDGWAQAEAIARGRQHDWMDQVAVASEGHATIADERETEARLIADAIHAAGVEARRQARLETGAHRETPAGKELGEGGTSPSPVSPSPGEVPGKYDLGTAMRLLADAEHDLADVRDQLAMAAADLKELRALNEGGVRALEEIASRAPARPLGGCACSRVAKAALGIPENAPVRAHHDADARDARKGDAMKPAIIGNPRTFDRGKPSPYAVQCPIHGKAYMTEREYAAQMLRPSSRWTCPVMDSDPARFGLCGEVSEFDDRNLEEWERYDLDDLNEGATPGTTKEGT